MSQVKKILCDAIKTFKEEEGYTYEQIEGGSCANRSQLINIINHSGDNVSVSVIEQVIEFFGYEISIEFTRDLFG